MTCILLTALFFADARRAEAATYDLYVDKNSGESAEDGSQQYPFKTIGSALDYIIGNNLKNKKVFIKNGEYKESVTLVNNTSLYGESRKGVVINAKDEKYGIRFSSTKSKIKKITVKGGRTNLKVSKKSKVTVSKCSISKARSNGIKINHSKSADRYKFVLRDSSVKKSGKRGLYIFKRKIEIVDSKIADSDEEGIDMHKGVRGKIKNSNIIRNGESGIETGFDRTKLKIKSNKIKSNKSSGISIQFRSLAGNGEIILEKNKLSGNKKWGVRYANYIGHGYGGKAFQKLVTESVELINNTIANNKKGEVYYQ